MADQHTVIEAECLEDGCDELEEVTHLGHARTDRQTEIVLDAHVEAARLHEEEAGHEFNVSVDTGTPSEMEALYEDLTGERLVADGGTEQESAASPRYGRGQLLMMKKTGCYWHVVSRFRNIDTGEVWYRVANPSHSQDLRYCEEDVPAALEDVGVSLPVGVKPASVFGGRGDDGILRGKNEGVSA